MPLAFLEYVQRQGSSPNSLAENYTVPTQACFLTYRSYPYNSTHTDLYDFLKNKGIKCPKCIWPLKGFLKNGCLDPHNRGGQFWNAGLSLIYFGYLFGMRQN